MVVTDFKQSSILRGNEGLVTICCFLNNQVDVGRERGGMEVVPPPSPPLALPRGGD